MKRTFEFKHVGPKAHVRQLIEELSDRLDEKLRHIPEETVFLHVLFEENGSHTLYRTALTCHVPGRIVAAHEESRNAGATIRKAFEEVERQLEKYTAVARREYLRRRSARTRQVQRQASEAARHRAMR